MHDILDDPYFRQLIEIAEARISENSVADIPKLFKDVPLDVFALLTCEPGGDFPAIHSYFPKMPDEELQHGWVGASGRLLLQQSIAFVRSCISVYEKHSGKLIKDARILDYGVGWGRLLRLFNKVAPEHTLYGVDAWKPILDVAKSLGVRGNVGLVDTYPTRLPFEGTFDFIFAFSILTHLSERSAKAAMRTCADALSDDGVLTITIHPVHAFDEHRNPAIVNGYKERGFGFQPNPQAASEDGDIPYGDTSISIDYIRNNWPWLKIVDVDYNFIDQQQILVSMKKTGAA